MHSEGVQEEAGAWPLVSESEDVEAVAEVRKPDGGFVPLIEVEEAAHIAVAAGDPS